MLPVELRIWPVALAAALPAWPLRQEVARLQAVEHSGQLQCLRIVGLQQTGQLIGERCLLVDQLPPVFRQQLQAARVGIVGFQGGTARTIPHHLHQQHRIDRITLGPAGAYALR